MPVRESLALDHFYISVEEADFEKLTSLKDILGATSHQKVVSGDDSWEGVYAGSRVKVYFEILKGRRPGGFGICLSPFNPLYIDANKIREELGQLPWQHGQRTRPDGAPWYDWIATCDYRDVENTVFNAWVMKYYLSHRDWTGPVPRASVDRYERIHLSVGEEHVAGIRAASEWFPGERIFGEKRVELTFPDRDGSPFRVVIDVVPGARRFELTELAIRLADVSVAERLLRHDFGSFAFKVSGETAIFRPK